MSTPKEQAAAILEKCRTALGLSDSALTAEIERLIERAEKMEVQELGAIKAVVTAAIDIGIKVNRENAALRGQVERLRADEKRLDWLLEMGCTTLYEDVNRFIKSREAIDAALAETGKERG